MNTRAHLPLEIGLVALKAEIRLTALRLRDVTRSLQRVPRPKPRLRHMRGGLWPRHR